LAGTPPTTSANTYIWKDSNMAADPNIVLDNNRAMTYTLFPDWNIDIIKQMIFAKK
jgi:hypothetical protein